MESIFIFLDKLIFTILKKNINKMPIRICKFVALYYTDARIRKLYFRRLGIFMGKGTYANLGLKVIPNSNKYCVIIGDHVSIGPNVVLIAESSPNNGVEIKDIEYVKNKLIKEKNIYIENDVWIGANVTILPGVRIGKCSVIGAGSVVINDIEDYSIYAGVPARKLRDLQKKI